MLSELDNSNLLTSLFDLDFDLDDVLWFQLYSIISSHLRSQSVAASRLHLLAKSHLFFYLCSHVVFGNCLWFDCVYCMVSVRDAPLFICALNSFTARYLLTYLSINLNIFDDEKSFQCKLT